MQIEYMNVPQPECVSKHGLYLTKYF